MTTSQKYFVIAALLWTVCGGFSLGAPVVAALGTTLIWQLRPGRTHTTFLVLSVLLGYAGALMGLLLSAVFAMTLRLVAILPALAAHHFAEPYRGFTFLAALLAGELRWRSLHAPPAGHSIFDDLSGIRFNAFLFALFSYGVWFAGGLVTYVLSPFIVPRLLAHWNPSLAGTGMADFVHSKLFSWAMYGFYGLLSVPAALLIWRLRPRRRFFAYLLPMLFSILIPAAGILLGGLVLVTMLWWGPWPYLLFTPLFTANIAAFFWAAVMGEVRWQIAKSPAPLTSSLSR